MDNHIQLLQIWIVSSRDCTLISDGLAENVLINVQNNWVIPYPISGKQTLTLNLGDLPGFGKLQYLGTEQSMDKPNPILEVYFGT